MNTKRIVALAIALVTWNLGTAQDLFITNARIIDGTGETIDQGSVSVADGRIVWSVAQVMNDSGATVLDAGGMTLMPGMMDTHWHVLTTTNATDAAHRPVHREHRR